MKKISVLIVDDEQVDRYLLVKQLRETDLEVSIFEESDGESALEFFKYHIKNHVESPEEFPPLLTFLDINMPRVNGFEFLQQFAELRIDANIDSSVIMMFSSSDHEEDRSRALAYDFVVDFLVKGNFDSRQLEKKIVSLL